MDELSKWEQEELPSPLYIPILRGLRPVRVVSPGLIDSFDNTDVFDERTRFDYFGRSKQPKIFTGLSIYEDIKKLLLGTEEDRQLIADFQSFLEKHVFHEKVTLIPKHDKDVLHIKVGNTPQREIYNLGDGLQTIITILFPVFIGKDQERMVFIEEPEAHLHPAWQSCLLNALKDIPNQQYFITTHSTVFINDASATLFSVRQESSTSTRLQRTDLEENKPEILRDLGYRQSDLLQANYILWVEGYSDKIYIEYWISQLAPDLVEGLHYTIMFFGGSSFSHLVFKDGVPDLSFVKRINRNLGLIMDSDRTKKGEKLSKAKQLVRDHFQENGLFCWVTTYREIENYIDPEDYESAVKAHHKKTAIEIDPGEYVDRNTVYEKDAPANYKATITLPQSVFQKNKDGSTSKIKDEDLRKAVEEAIKATAKMTLKTDKIAIAKAYVHSVPEVPNGEVKEKLFEVIKTIRQVNNQTLI